MCKVHCTGEGVTVVVVDTGAHAGRAKPGSAEYLAAEGHGGYLPTGIDFAESCLPSCRYGWHLRLGITLWRASGRHGAVGESSHFHALTVFHHP